MVSTTINQFKFIFFFQTACYTERFPYTLQKDVIPSPFLWAERLVSLLTGTTRDMKFKCRRSVIPFTFKQEWQRKDIMKKKASLVRGQFCALLCIYAHKNATQRSLQVITTSLNTGINRKKVNTDLYCCVKYEKTEATEGRQSRFWPCMRA